MSPLQ